MYWVWINSILYLTYNHSFGLPIYYVKFIDRQTWKESMDFYNKIYEYKFWDEINSGGNK